MKYFIQATTLMGIVEPSSGKANHFTIRSQTGDEYDIRVKEQTEFRSLMNLDDINNDRFVDPSHPPSNPQENIATYLHEGMLVAVQATHQMQDDKSIFDGICVHILTTTDGEFLFEQTHWWLNQIARLADEWLDDLFGDRRTYREDDFAELYRTNLNIIGLPTDDNIQEMATLSRLIYGLSSSYLLTGDERYLLAAGAGVRFQREAFLSLSHDGERCFWAYGRRRQKYGTQWKLLSENGDDFGSIPLYEQIYALAGLAQYYRITNDREVLEDIRRTVKTFNDFYRDCQQNNPDFPGLGGYFSHLDYATMSPDSPALGPNRMRKNWNSIGDHIPAYLLNLLLALDPLPIDGEEDLAQFLNICREMLDDCVENIVSHFPDPDPKIPYVNERFYQDWKPEHDWGWQQNRAIVGHNLKIAWNLTRVINYYQSRGQLDKIDKPLKVATTLADKMLTFGLDRVRGGCFDAVEREPKNGMDFEFTWSSTKDFWQQEQGILAYLILYGHTAKAEYLQAAREMMAFWNLFFLDRNNKGIFFRVTDIGSPVIEGDYGNKAGHAIAGYHSFELNYLAHLYIRSLVRAKIQADSSDFCLYFHIAPNHQRKSINVLPDYLPYGQVKIQGLTINGVARPVDNIHNFQIPLEDKDLIPDQGCNLTVRFSNVCQETPVPINEQGCLKGKKIAILVESEYIPHEIECYRRRFQELGATVHFMSRLWNQEKAIFINDVDPLGTDRKIYEFPVCIDFEKVNLDDYAAVLMAANYCSVRLRYFEHPEGTPIGAEEVKSAPAAKFFARAMANKSIVKGALCHGLWILTPRPDLLKGRKVICHEVVAADILNAGAIYTPSPSKVVVDDDLVTGYSAHEVEDYVNRIAEVIVAKNPPKKSAYKPLF